MQETKFFDSKEDLIFNTNFQYIEIDEKSLEILKEKDLREPLGNKKVELKKWCVDTKHPIALLSTGWVSSMIARTDGSSYWYFLLMVNGNYTGIEFVRQGLSINAEEQPIKTCEINISSDFAEKNGFTVKQLKVAVCEAIRVIEIGEKDDYKKNRELEEQEDIRKTPNKIMYGEFSEMLKQCINSITEIENMEQHFRAICLRHFKEYNLAVQNFSGFYLHNDEDSYFIFDVIIWMYLHIDKNATIKKIATVYPSISNENYMYRRNVYEQHFCLMGSIHFLTEHYFTDRINEGKIILNQGEIQFSQQHLEDIIEKLIKDVKEVS